MPISINETNDDAARAFLTNSFGDRYLHAVNRQVFNAVGAASVFQSSLPDNFWNEDSLFIVIGTDSGLLVEYVAKHGVPAGSRYLFVELDELFDQVAARTQPLQLDPRIVLSKVADWKSTAMQMSLEDYFYLEGVHTIRSVGAVHAFLSGYVELSRALTNEIRDLGRHLLRHSSRGYFIQCQLFNSAENQIPASVLKSTYRGKTAVLIASGPSLDDQLPWIKENREKFVVTAISRSARRLLQAQVTPDIVFTIDPTPMSFDISKEMLTFDPRVLLIHAYHAEPRLVAQWRGPKVYMGSRFPWEDETSNIHVAGPTVSNAAISMLIEMGFSQIVLVGLDLCFKPDGARYAAGNNESELGPVLGQIDPKVETNDGQMADTMVDFIQAVRDIGAQAARAKELGCRLVNPAPGAAKIPAVDHVRTHDLVFEPLHETSAQHLARILPSNDRDRRLVDYRRLDANLDRESLNLKKVKSLAGEILRYSDGLFGRNGKKKNPKYKIKIDKTEKRLESELNVSHELVKAYVTREFRRFATFNRVRTRKIDEVETYGREYFTAYRGGASQLLRLIELTRERIASRINEESTTPNIDALREQWRRDNTPGRAAVWQHQHPEEYAGLCAKDKATIAESLSTFAAQIAETETPHMARCRESLSLENVPGKIKLLFSQRDIAGLRRIVDGLAKAHDPNAKFLHLFASGQLAELENREGDAFVHYQEISEGLLLEDALRRISYLCLQHGDERNAQLALECLTHISISYVPQYAELLWVLGQFKQASALFSQYLERVPDDIATYLRVGKLFLEKGAHDVARMSFMRVLERDPENQAARNILLSMDKSLATSQ